MHHHCRTPAILRDLTGANGKQRCGKPSHTASITACLESLQGAVQCTLLSGGLCSARPAQDLKRPGPLHQPSQRNAWAIKRAHSCKQHTQQQDTQPCTANGTTDHDEYTTPARPGINSCTLRDAIPTGQHTVMLVCAARSAGDKTRHHQPYLPSNASNPPVLLLAACPIIKPDFSDALQSGGQAMLEHTSPETWHYTHSIKYATYWYILLSQPLHSTQCCNAVLCSRQP